LLPESTVRQYRQRFELHTLTLPASFADVTTQLATLPRPSWSRALEVFMEGMGELEEERTPVQAAVS